jgi:plasmid stabilization system protein ParE
MNRYKFTPQAADDLFGIWSYIACDGTAAANRVEDAVYKACDFLAEGRLRGSIREDLTKLPLRFWTLQDFPNFIIVYDPESDPLRIIRIFHGRRDILAVLGASTPRELGSPPAITRVAH